MKTFAFSLLVFGCCSLQAQAAEDYDFVTGAAGPSKLTAEMLNKYVGAYTSRAYDHQNKLYAYFLKDDVVLKSNGHHLSHYFLLRSNNPLTSEPVAMQDAEAMHTGADFYLSDDGKFYQSWRGLGLYQTPAELADIDQVKPGEHCGWKLVTAQSGISLDMNYCGNGNPHDHFTFGGGGAILKIQYVRHDIDSATGHYGWIVDEIFAHAASE